MFILHLACSSQGFTFGKVTVQREQNEEEKTSTKPKPIVNQVNLCLERSPQLKIKPTAQHNRLTLEQQCYFIWKNNSYTGDD